MGDDNNWADPEEEEGGGGGGGGGPWWDPFGLFTDPKDSYSSANPDRWGGSPYLGDNGPRGTHADPGYYFEPPPGLSRENMYVKVDYNWLAFFAKQLRELDPVFGRALDTMAPVKFQCGSRFAAGKGLQEFVIGPNGTAGLKGQYIENLTAVRNSVAKFAEKLEVMAKNYSDSEALQDLTVDDVQTMFGDVLSQVKMRPVYAPPAT